MGFKGQRLPKTEQALTLLNSWRLYGGWWAHQDLNLEPTDYESAALTVELWARPFIMH